MQWEHKDHCLESREKATTAEEGRRALHGSSSIRARSPRPCEVLSTLSTLVPSRLLLSRCQLDKSDTKSVPAMPFDSLSTAMAHTIGTLQPFLPSQNSFS